ncbi:hypothetical protein HF520_01135 [Romboutsia sp. CE17]|uniref:hypothetical protein n=1 Tax=Romboutsia sp. CE17 TaxID=2724150 RepID=UPI001442BE41|nr:hypothetical protein [Romboutsia sp. CE17]QJA07632.1 hypothetical protein HF520_01135 [Romboutsia sp. CE17]
MIAEIQGKISSTGSNLNERLEDNLTGNFFGTLRYMSFENGLKKILLQGVTPKNDNVIEIIKNINVEEWSDNISFWPYDKEGEIDVILDFDNCIIGIEVKYLSGISSDDDISNDENSFEDKIKEDKSIQQLARESRIISKKGPNKEKILIFIADQQSCIDVYKDVTKRNIIEKDVNLVYISWQNILEIMKNLQCTNKYEKIIIDDLISLLTKKGFDQFKEFLIEDLIINEAYYEFGDIKREINKYYICFFNEKNIEGDLYYEF